jgi:hypothetical protein
MAPSLLRRRIDMNRSRRFAAVFVALVTTVGSPAIARAATIVWGGGTGSWGTASNWIGGAAPGASDTASLTGWVPMNRAGWTVTSSTGSGQTSAIDGSWGTRFTTGTNAASGQWFKIDLGSTQTFSRIVLDDTGDASDYPPGYDVYVSADNVTWSSSIANGTGAVVTTINFTSQAARYIKIQVNAAGTHWWSFREVFVYTTGNADDTQLARTGWTVTASHNPGTVNNAIDSALSTRWDTGTNAAAGQWFKIDLGTAVSIDRVDFSSYTDQSDYPPAYDVRLSTDDSTYTMVASGTGAAAFISASFTARAARYVLIDCTATGANSWSIHDLNVYGTPRAATISSSATVAALTVGKGSLSQGSGATLTLTGAYTQTGGAFTGGDSALGVGGTFGLSGGTFTAGSGAVTISGAATINGAATLNAGTSGNFTFGSTLAIGSGTAGTFDAGSATVTFTGAVALQNGGTFNGNTGSGSFSAAPTLTSGTFGLAAAGSTGRWTFNQSTTFSSGVTLNLPSDRGELSMSPGTTLALNGPVTSNVGASSTLPKIDCNGCSGSQGITVAFGATSTVNVNGLEIDNSVASGVSVANGATLTLFKRVAFKNNAGGSGSTHLAITLASGLLNAPGCYFDATAAHNVTLYGDSGSPAGARAMFESQGASVNGSGAGPSLDQDGDSNGDNIGDNTATGPYYGSVVEWVNASATDTSGSNVGFPTAAFDWNTFSWYGVYASYKDTTGAATADVVWKRNDDGSAAYSYSVPQSSGDLIGTPAWDTVDETATGLDVNGDGDQLDKNVHVVYLATTAGHVIKLIDTGSALSRPASGVWTSDFTSSSVASVSSPLTSDGTNLYFGGTTGSSTPQLFGLQVAGGANEKTLQKAIGSVSLITTTPSFHSYGGSLYAFVGSTATSNQAYVYRVNVTSGNVNSSFSGVTANVNDSSALVGDRVYAVTDGGTLHVLDAANFDPGGFTNLSGFPYQTAAAKAIARAPWVDYYSGTAYFGDDGGALYAVTSSGANLSGFPFSLSGSIKITSSPLYLRGVIAVGANDGSLYFIDRQNGSNTPNLFKRFFVTSGGSVSTVAYNSNTQSYMVSSSDGKLVFVNGADVTDPTPTIE